MCGDDPQYGVRVVAFQHHDRGLKRPREALLTEPLRAGPSIGAWQESVECAWHRPCSEHIMLAKMVRL